MEETKKKTEPNQEEPKEDRGIYICPGWTRIYSCG